MGTIPKTWLIIYKTCLLIFGAICNISSHSIFWSAKAADRHWWRQQLLLFNLWHPKIKHLDLCWVLHVRMGVNARVSQTLTPQLDECYCDVWPIQVLNVGFCLDSGHRVRKQPFRLSKQLPVWIISFVLFHGSICYGPNEQNKNFFKPFIWNTWHFANIQRVLNSNRIVHDYDTPGILNSASIILMIVQMLSPDSLAWCLLSPFSERAKLRSAVWLAERRGGTKVWKYWWD